MKNIIKKIVIVTLCLMFSVQAFACNPDVTEHIDNSRTQVYVSVYGGGLGTDWVNTAKRKFEDFYKERSFETGKKGVQVIIDSGKSSTAGDSLLSTISGNNNDVFFTEAVYYYDLVTQNKIADISDIVTQKLTAYSESKSIEDKMTDELISFYKTNDKYYALPYYDGYYGIIYNIDLFEEFNLYFTENYREYDEPDDMFVLDETEDRSAGPDGKTGTPDDGLPATYDDFYILCEKMISYGLVPFVWSGKYAGHTAYMMYQMWADYEGAEQFYLNYSFDGTANNLVKSVSDSGEVALLDPTTISTENGVMLQKQAGKYYALDFMSNIIHPENPTSQYYHNLSFSPSLSHTDAQTEFLTSIVKSSEKICMLVDGNWWEREADSTNTFAGLKKYGYNKEDMKFGLMPFPKATDEKVGEKRTVVSINDSLCCINAKSSGVRLQLAKLFLQFCHTDESLADFTASTSVTKPFKYTMTDAQLSGLTHYGKELYDLKTNENVDVVYPYSDSKVFLNNFASFHPSEWSWTINEGKVPATIFKDKNMTSKQYFEKLYPAYVPKWNTYKDKK